jgi:hypothetical protein
MLLPAILAMASMLFVGCASREMTPAQRRELLTQPTLTPEQRQEILARTTATIVGTVRESGTKRALEGVFVTAQYFGDLTKADGRFRIEYVDPGKVKVFTWRRDLIEASQQVVARAGRETTANLFVDAAPPACCRLAGTWSVRLMLQEPGELPTPRGTEVVGSITFSPDTPDPFPEARTHVPADDRTLDEFGTYEIDLRPMLGADITRSTSYAIFPGRPGSDILTEAEGHVHHRNEVEIALIPRMSHGGLSLTGTIEGDEVHGTWIKRDYAPTVTGTFVMLRKSRE